MRELQNELCDSGANPGAVGPFNNVRSDLKVSNGKTGGIKANPSQQSHERLTPMKSSGWEVKQRSVQPSTDEDMIFFLSILQQTLLLSTQKELSKKIVIKYRLYTMHHTAWSTAEHHWSDFKYVKDWICVFNDGWRGQLMNTEGPLSQFHFERLNHRTIWSSKFISLSQCRFQSGSCDYWPSNQVNINIVFVSVHH